jgi:ACT domain-containing protein
MDISGSLTKTKEDTKSLEGQKNQQEFHIINIGKLIESNETDMRSDIESVYCNKARQIINTGRLHEIYMSNEEKKSSIKLSSKTSETSSNAIIYLPPNNLALNIFYKIKVDSVY